MTKEIVYLDLADDITTITAKVTRGQGQLIALVLPKSLGALRNIVNLRLLTRVAEQHNKKIVLVSSNPEMLPLAGQVGLPVAKSLRDQPILPPKPEGEAERTIDEPLTDETESSATLTAAEVATVDAAAEQTTDETLGEDPLSDEHLVPKVKLAETETDTQVKSFKDWFKTHMWWIIAPVAALILLIVGVMVFVKPKATVEVLARTSKYNFSEKISFTKNEAEANPEQGIFFLIEQKLEKTSECEFQPTGEKETGEYSRGEISFNYSGFGASITTSDVVVIGGLNYHPVETTAIGQGQNTIVVRADNLGEEYNQSTGQSFTVKGSSFTANSMNIVGGSKRTITTVSQGDYDTALAALPVVNRQAGETELANSFAADVLALPRAAFSSTTGDPISTPAVDEETTPDQMAVIKQTTTFVGYGVKKTDLERFIESKEQTRLENQPGTRIFDLGFDKIFFDAYSETDGQMGAWLKTTTVVGPDISEESIKEAIAGKKTAEATRVINGKDIMSATVKLNLFWASTVPTDYDRIMVEIKIGD